MAIGQCACSDRFIGQFPADSDGVMVTAEATGSVTEFPMPYLLSCGGTVSLPGISTYIGQSGTYTLSLRFSEPVNNVRVMLAAASDDIFREETFAFDTNEANTRIIQVCGCMEIISDTEIKCLSCGDDGAKVEILADNAFTELTISGEGGSAGSLFGLCGLEPVVCDTPIARWIDPPADMTVSCSDLPISTADLVYDNESTELSCRIMGDVLGVLQGEAGRCGGELTQVWEYTDLLGRSISHTQTITVTPAAQATWINIPLDVTVDCSDLPEPLPLAYSNDLSGSCEISGMVRAEVIGEISTCGAELRYQYTYRDECDRVLSHVRDISVQATSPPVFIETPTDLTIECSEIQTLSDALAYSNQLDSSCLIAGVAQAEYIGEVDFCGGELLRRWTLSDSCGNRNSVEQLVTVLPATAPFLQNLPQDMTIQSSEVFPDGEVVNFSNLETDCLYEEVIEGQQTINGDTAIIHWVAVDPCTGDTSEHRQQIIRRRALIDFPFYVPNVFSPNGDGLNDVFQLGVSQLADFMIRIAIYDRWGNLVFAASGMPNQISWDGMSKGQACQEAVYMVQIGSLSSDLDLPDRVYDLSLIR